MHQTRANPGLPKKKESGNTYVYIWKTLAPKSVGHVAVEVGGAGEEGGHYMSIHPGLLPAVGPTTVWPMPAVLSSTLAEDMEIEATYQQLAPDPDEPATLVRTPYLAGGLPPDHIFKFAHLDTQAMRTFMQTVRDEVPVGQTTYQLFPKVNAYGFFKDISHCLTYNPIDARHSPSRQPSKQGYGANPYNCATLVSRILKEGGMSIQESNTPWGQSPNGLAEQLSKIKP